MRGRCIGVMTLTVLAVVAGASSASRQDGDPGAALSSLRIDAASRITISRENVKPFLAARPEGGAYLAWVQRAGAETAVCFARSLDGRSFGKPVRLNPEGMALDLGAESGPHVAVDGKGTVYVVWAAGIAAPAARGGTATGHGGKGGHPPRPGNLAVYLVKSCDEGRTWSAPRQVNDGPDGPERRFPTVAADGAGVIYVAWLDKRHESTERPGFSRVYLSRSSDGGETFASDVDATRKQGNSICHCCKVALAAHPSVGVCVAFRNDCRDLRNICVVRSPDDGGAWSPPADIEETKWILPACPMNGPSLAIDAGGDLHVVWSTGARVAGKPLFPGQPESSVKVMYRRFDARRQTWEPPLYLGSGSHPRVAIDAGGARCVTWRSEQIMLARLANDGAGAPAALPLSPSEAMAAYPALCATADGGVLVAWQQREEDGPSQIHLARISGPDQ